MKIMNDYNNYIIKSLHHLCGVQNIVNRQQFCPLNSDQSHSAFNHSRCQFSYYFFFIFCRFSELLLSLVPCHKLIYINFAEELEQQRRQATSPNPKPTYHGIILDSRFVIYKRKQQQFQWKCFYDRVNCRRRVNKGRDGFATYFTIYLIPHK